MVMYVGVVSITVNDDDDNFSERVVYGTTVTNLASIPLTLFW
jgi:hypothetical protein